MQIECNRFLCIQSVSVEIDSRAKSTSGGYSAWRVVGPQAIFDLEIAKLSSASYGIDSPMTYTMGRMHSDAQFAGRSSESVTTLW